MWPEEWRKVLVTHGNVASVHVDYDVVRVRRVRIHIADAKPSSALRLSQMKEGKLTPADAVNVAVAQIEKQTEKMPAAGTSRTNVLVWLKGLRATVSERISALTEPDGADLSAH